MKTAIVYYSKHHGNTKKLVDAIVAAHPDVDTFNAMEDIPDLSGYDCIGLASGIYAEHPAKQVRNYAKEKLPNGKKVFLLVTTAMPNDNYFKDLSNTVAEKSCELIGKYQCKGFNTFGPFILIGGTAKGHPTQEELDEVVRFYEGL